LVIRFRNGWQIVLSCSDQQNSILVEWIFQFSHLTDTGKRKNTRLRALCRYNYVIQDNSPNIFTSYFSSIMFFFELLYLEHLNIIYSQTIEFCCTALEIFRLLFFKWQSLFSTVNFLATIFLNLNERLVFELFNFLYYS